MNGLELPGVRFRAAVFEPTFHKFVKQTCGGMQIHVTDRGTFMPVLTGAALLVAFHKADPGRFAWRSPPYEYEHDKWPIDILAGSSELRMQVEADTDPRVVAAGWADALDRFRALRLEYLMYEA